MSGILLLNWNASETIVKAKVTANISMLSNKITSMVTSAKAKAHAIWEHTKAIPYDVFGITPENIDVLAKQNSLTCYGKALLQASMAEAENIPWRFELSKCPSHAVEETIKALGEKNPLLMKTYEKFPQLFEGKELLHTTVQVNVDGGWKRMDATLPSDVCNKIKDDNKRMKCDSMDNVTAVHDCKVIGYSKELPYNTVSSWNVISHIGKWVNGKLFSR